MEPRYSWPPTMMPVPTPVPASTVMEFAAASGRERYSPSAARLASLSVMAGTPSAASSSAPTSWLCQPGMREGATTTRRTASTGPGRQMPTESRSPPSASSMERIPAASSSTVASGPWVTSMAIDVVDRMARERSESPRRACLAPMEITATRPVW